MNLPNKLTVLRVLLVPVFIVFALLGNIHGYWYEYLVAAVVFSVASITDFLDGKIARKNGIVTDFGKFMDPLADKILTTTAFLYMMQAGVCDPIVVCIILAREFAVAGLRMVAASSKDGIVIAANIWGKAKTVIQMITVLLFYFGMTLNFSIGSVAWRDIIWWASYGMCWVCGAATLLSGVIYLWDGRSYIKTAK